MEAQRISRQRNGYVEFVEPLDHRLPSRLILLAGSREGEINPAYHSASFQKANIFTICDRMLRYISEYSGIYVHGTSGIVTFSAAFALPIFKSKAYFFVPHGALDPRRITGELSDRLWARVKWWVFEARLVHSAKSVLFSDRLELAIARSKIGSRKFKGLVVGRAVAEFPDVEQRNDAFPALHALANEEFLIFWAQEASIALCQAAISAFSEKTEGRAKHIIIFRDSADDDIRPVVEQVEQLGLSARVHWGRCSDESEKDAAYRSAGAFLIACPGGEAEVARALAYGLPVFATAASEFWPDIVRNGAGFMRNHDEDGVADLIKAWIELSFDEKNQIRSAAVSLFGSAFSSKNRQRRVDELRLECCN